MNIFCILLFRNSIVKNLEEIFDASQNLQNEEQSNENFEIPHDLLE